MCAYHTGVLAVIGGTAGFRGTFSLIYSDVALSVKSCRPHRRLARSGFFIGETASFRTAAIGEFRTPTPAEYSS